MFHFPALPPNTLYIQMLVTRNNSGQVSPFGHPRITARLPTPRGLSQATTSFIGSVCQGIHRTLLNTYKKPKMLASTIQFSTTTPTPQQTNNPNSHQPITGSTRHITPHPNSMPTKNLNHYPLKTTTTNTPTTGTSATPTKNNKH